MQVLLRELYEESVTHVARRCDPLELTRRALHRIEDRLSELVVPPADASSRAAGSSSKGEVDILGADIITDKIVSTGRPRSPSLRH